MCRKVACRQGHRQSSVNHRKFCRTSDAEKARNCEMEKRFSSPKGAMTLKFDPTSRRPSMTIRRLIAQPFRNYANFSGRSGRMEFWLFILTFTAITQGSALVASGLATLVTDDRLQEKPYHRLEHHELWHRWHDENARITFMIHRHDHSTGFHLHGMVNPETGQSRDRQSRQSGETRHQVVSAGGMTMGITGRPKRQDKHSGCSAHYCC